MKDGKHGMKPRQRQKTRMDGEVLARRDMIMDDDDDDTLSMTI